jgi:Uma2 family endonuclease
MFEAAQAPPSLMIREEFYRWSELQPRGRFELEAGEVVAMAPERAAHARAKFSACLALREAIQRTGLPCEAFIDGFGIAIDEHTSYEPDVLVNCGEPVDGDAIVAPNPVVVVEVTSPSNSRVDMTTKLADYFRVPSVQHYLVVNLRRRVVLHHRRSPDAQIGTSILAAGPIALDPPGITVQAEALFGLA